MFCALMFFPGVRSRTGNGADVVVVGVVDDDDDGDDDADVADEISLPSVVDVEGREEEEEADDVIVEMSTANK